MRILWMTFQTNPLCVRHKWVFTGPKRDFMENVMVYEGIYAIQSDNHQIQN